MTYCSLTDQPCVKSMHLMFDLNLVKFSIYWQTLTLDEALHFRSHSDPWDK